LPRKGKTTPGGDASIKGVRNPRVVDVRAHLKAYQGNLISLKRESAGYRKTFRGIETFRKEGKVPNPRSPYERRSVSREGRLGALEGMLSLRSRYHRKGKALRS